MSYRIVGVVPLCCFLILASHGAAQTTCKTTCWYSTNDTHTNLSGGTSNGGNVHGQPFGGGCSPAHDCLETEEDVQALVEALFSNSAHQGALAKSEMAPRVLVSLRRDALVIPACGEGAPRHAITVTADPQRLDAAFRVVLDLRR